MQPNEIVPGAEYRKGKVVRRVLTIKDQTRIALLVEVTRNERGVVVGHGKTLADPVIAVAERDEKGRVMSMLVSVGGEPPRAVKPNEGLRYRWEGGTVVYCPVGSPMDAKEMTREAFAAWAEARAN